MESARIAQSAAGPAMIAGLESRRIAGELEKEPGHIDVEIPNTTEQTKSIWSRQAEKIADVNVFDPGYPVGFHSKIAKALNFPEVRLGDIGTTLTTGILTLALGKEGMAEYERDRAVKTAREGEMPAYETVTYGPMPGGGGEMIMPSRAQILKTSREAKKTQEAVKGMTDEQVLAYLEETNPGSTEGYIQNIQPSVLDILAADVAGVGPIAGASKMSRIIKTAQRELKFDDPSLLKVVAKSDAGEKITESANKIVGDTPNIPTPEEVWKTIQSMKLDNVAAKKLVSTGMGSNLISKISPVQAVQSDLIPLTWDLPTKPVEMAKALTQRFLIHQQQLSTGTSLGNIAQVEFSTLMKMHGPVVNQDATVNVLLKSTGRKVRVGVVDFMEEADNYKPDPDFARASSAFSRLKEKPAVQRLAGWELPGTDTPALDFLQSVRKTNADDFSDEFWDMRGKMMDNIDVLTRRLEDAGEVVPRVDFGIKGDISRGNRRHHYFPRGQAARDADVERVANQKGYGRAKSRLNYDRDRLWGRQIEGIESGLEYEKDLGLLLGRYNAEIHNRLADIDLGRQLEPLGKQLRNAATDALRKEESRLRSLERATVKNRETMGSIRKGSIILKEKTSSKTIKTKDDLSKAKIKDVDEARLIASAYIAGKETPEMVQKWRAVSPELKRSLMAGDEVPDSFITEQTITNRRLQRLGAALGAEGDEFVDELTRAQNLTDKTARESTIKKLQQRFEETAGRQFVEQHERMAVWEPSVRADALKIKAIQGGQKARKLDRLSTPQVRDHYFNMDAANYIDKYLGESATEYFSTLSKFNDASRLLTLTLDNAAPMNQGLYYLVTAPLKFVKTMGLTMQAIVNPAVWEQNILRNVDFWKEYVSHGGVFDSSEFFTGMERGSILSRLGDVAAKGEAYIGRGEFGPVRLPDIVKFEGKSRVPRAASWVGDRPQAAFNVLRDDGRRELYKALKPVWEADGTSMPELVSFIDNMIGVSKGIGLSNKQKSIESLIFLARGYYRAHMGIIASTMMGGMRGRQARKSMSGLMMSMMAMHEFSARALGQEARWDPTDPHFMMVEVDGVWIGIPGFQRSVIRFIGNMVQHEAEKRDPDSYAYFPNDHEWHNHPILRFIRGRGSATAKLASTLVTGQDFVGQEFTDLPGLAGYVGSTMFTPLAIQDILMEKPSLPIWAAPFSFAGMHARPETYRQQLNDYRDNKAMEVYGRPWSHREAARLGVKTIDRNQKRALNEKFPEMQEIEDRWMEDLEDEKGTGFIRQYNMYQVEMDRVQEGHNERIDALLAEVRDAQKLYQEGKTSLDRRQSTVQLRDKLADLGEIQGKLYDDVDARFPRVSEFFSTIEDQPPLSTSPALDVAVQDYYRKITFNPLLNKGTEFDYALYEQMEKEFVDRWDKMSGGNGEQIYWEVIKSMRTNRDLPPVVLELNEAKIRLKPYFRIGEELARQSNLLELWKEQGSDSFYGERSPEIRELKRIEAQARIQLRRDDRYLDLALMRFYGTKSFENEENEKDFGTEEGKMDVTSLDFSLSRY